MNRKYLFAPAAAILVFVASNANAQFLAIGSYVSAGSGKDLYWKNGNAGSTSKNATFFTTSLPGQTIAGPADVLFSFDPMTGVAATSIPAWFSLFAAVTNTAATVSGASITQTGLTGSFSFIAKNSANYGNLFIPAGGNLLSSPNFSGATLSGLAGGSSAVFNGDSIVGTLQLQSDFLTLTGPFSFSINIAGITPTLHVLPNAALASFDPGSSGSFYAAAAVPEPASWTLMIAGFGMIGGSVRQRRRVTA